MDNKYLNKKTYDKFSVKWINYEGDNAADDLDDDKENSDTITYEFYNNDKYIYKIENSYIIDTILEWFIYDQKTYFVFLIDKETIGLYDAISGNLIKKLILGYRWPIINIKYMKVPAVHTYI